MKDKMCKKQKKNLWSLQVKKNDIEFEKTNCKDLKKIKKMRFTLEESKLLIKNT